MNIYLLSKLYKIKRKYLQIKLLRMNKKKLTEINQVVTCN